VVESRPGKLQEMLYVFKIYVIYQPNLRDRASVITTERQFKGNLLMQCRFYKSAIKMEHLLFNQPLNVVCKKLDESSCIQREKLVRCHFFEIIPLDQLWQHRKRLGLK
jgi:hypothetical protein